MGNNKDKDKMMAVNAGSTMELIPFVTELLKDNEPFIMIGLMNGKVQVACNVPPETAQQMLEIGLESSRALHAQSRVDPATKKMLDDAFGPERPVAPVDLNAALVAALKHGTHGEA